MCTRSVQSPDGKKSRAESPGSRGGGGGTKVDRTSKSHVGKYDPRNPSGKQCKSSAFV